MFEDIANKVYEDVQHQQRKGNTKAGVPEGASEELASSLRRLFLSNKKVKWKDVLEVYGESE